MSTRADADDLTALNINIAEWEQRRDRDCTTKLDALLSPSLLFRRADGTVVNKDAFMLGLQKPSPFTHRRSEEVAVTVAGDRALATLVVVATRPDGAVGRYRNVRLFFHRDATWQLEFWFNDDVTALAAG
jgi:hypothetical protein